MTANGRRSLPADLRDAITPRTVLIVVGVLLLQLGFILSYVGAFHHPEPRHVRVSIVAPASVSARAVDAINAIPGSPLRATSVGSEAEARKLIIEQRSSGALVIDPSGTNDTVLVSSGGGSAVATVTDQYLSEIDAAQQRTAKVQDVDPLQPGDNNGLTAFYLVVGWLIGGYLATSIIGITRGSLPPTLRRAVIRVTAMVPYAVVSGLGGAVIVDPVLGALQGHFFALWGAGALVVLCAVTVSMAAQVLLGTIGIGLVVLLFVVLGNPSAGGPYQAALLPPFWRAIGSALPNGAGVQLLRDSVYFAGRGAGSPILVLVAWTVGGLVVMLAGAARHQRRAPAEAATAPA